MIKVQVGDRVRVVKVTGDPESEGHEEFQRYIGETGIVYATNRAHYGVGVDFDGSMKLWFASNELEVIK